MKTKILNKKPCIKVCKFNKSHNICIGCGLKKKESKRWKNYSLKNKNFIAHQLFFRLRHLSN